VLEVYDVASNSWSTRAPMPAPRGFGGSGAADGKLYAVGGTDNSAGQYFVPHSETLAYDPSTDAWTRAASMPDKLANAASAAWDGKIYVFGGQDQGATGILQKATWVYDPRADSWSAGPPLNVGRWIPAAAAGDGTVFAAGSTEGNAPAASFEYLPLDSSRRSRPRSPAAADVRSVSPPAAGSNAATSRAAPTRRAAQRPNDYALVVGIDSYSRLPAARFAENDADAIKERLLALGYPERNIVLLKGGQATRGAMQGYLEEWLPKNAGRSSRVVFYFSGHGSPDPKNGDAYLVPWDGDAMFLKSTAYPLKSLYDSLSKLKARRVIVALDSCFSGAGGRSVLVAGARPLVSVVDTTEAPAGVTVLTAASGDEITGTIDAQSHGAFTYYLLQALDHGKRTARAAYVELKPLVQDEAHRQNREQTPLLLGDDAAF
jgi:hypothetical protein